FAWTDTFRVAHANPGQGTWPARRHETHPSTHIEENAEEEVRVLCSEVSHTLHLLHVAALKDVLSSPRIQIGNLFHIEPVDLDSGKPPRKALTIHDFFRKQSASVNGKMSLRALGLHQTNDPRIRWVTRGSLTLVRVQDTPLHERETLAQLNELVRIGVVVCTRDGHFPLVHLHSPSTTQAPRPGANGANQPCKAVNRLP